MDAGISKQHILKQHVDLINRFIDYADQIGDKDPKDIFLKIEVDGKISFKDKSSTTGSFFQKSWTWLRGYKEEYEEYDTDKIKKDLAKQFHEINAMSEEDFREAIDTIAKENSLEGQVKADAALFAISRDVIRQKLQKASETINSVFNEVLTRKEEKTMHFAILPVLDKEDRFKRVLEQLDVAYSFLKPEEFGDEFSVEWKKGTQDEQGRLFIWLLEKACETRTVDEFTRETKIQARIVRRVRDQKHPTGKLRLIETVAGLSMRLNANSNNLCDFIQQFQTELENGNKEAALIWLEKQRHNVDTKNLSSLFHYMDLLDAISSGMQSIAIEAQDGTQEDVRVSIREYEEKFYEQFSQGIDDFIKKSESKNTLEGLHLSRRITKIQAKASESKILQGLLLKKYIALESGQKLVESLLSSETRAIFDAAKKIDQHIKEPSKADDVEELLSRVHQLKEDPVGKKYLESIKEILSEYIITINTSTFTEEQLTSYVEWIIKNKEILKFNPNSVPAFIEKIGKTLAQRLVTEGVINMKSTQSVPPLLQPSSEKITGSAPPIMMGGPPPPPMMTGGPPPPPIKTGGPPPPPMKMGGPPPPLLMPHGKPKLVRAGGSQSSSMNTGGPGGSENVEAPQSIKETIKAQVIEKYTKQAQVVLENNKKIQGQIDEVEDLKRELENKEKEMRPFLKKLQTVHEVGRGIKNSKKEISFEEKIKIIEAFDRECNALLKSNEFQIKSKNFSLEEKEIEKNTVRLMEIEKSLAQLAIKKSERDTLKSTLKAVKDERVLKQIELKSLKEALSALQARHTEEIKDESLFEQTKRCTKELSDYDDKIRETSQRMEKIVIELLDLQCGILENKKAIISSEKNFLEKEIKKAKNKEQGLKAQIKKEPVSEWIQKGPNIVKAQLLPYFQSVAKTEEEKKAIVTIASMKNWNSLMGLSPLEVAYATVFRDILRSPANVLSPKEATVVVKKVSREVDIAKKEEDARKNKEDLDVLCTIKEYSEEKRSGLTARPDLVGIELRSIRKDVEAYLIEKGVEKKRIAEILSTSRGLIDTHAQRIKQEYVDKIKREVQEPNKTYEQIISTYGIGAEKSPKEVFLYFLKRNAVIAYIEDEGISHEQGQKQLLDEVQRNNVILEKYFLELTKKLNKDLQGKSRDAKPLNDPQEIVDAYYHERKNAYGMDAIKSTHTLLKEISIPHQIKEEVLARYLTEFDTKKDGFSLTTYFIDSVVPSEELLKKIVEKLEALDQKIRKNPYKAFSLFYQFILLEEMKGRKDVQKFFIENFKAKINDHNPNAIQEARNIYLYIQGNKNKYGELSVALKAAIDTPIAQRRVRVE